MMIVILGNMGVGKTTVASQLSESLDIPFFSIDNMRCKCFKKTPRLSDQLSKEQIQAIIKKELKWEKKAKDLLIKNCLSHKHIILETLGVSDVYSKIIQEYVLKYPSEKIVAFQLFAPINFLEKRVLKRSKKGIVPVPQKWKCEWGNCFMSDEDCLLYSLKWANDQKSHFEPYIQAKWDSQRNSSKTILKKIIKYLNS